MKVWIVEAEFSYTEAVYSNEAAAREHVAKYNHNEATRAMRAVQFEVWDEVPESVKAPS